MLGPRRRYNAIGAGTVAAQMIQRAFRSYMAGGNLRQSVDHNIKAKKALRKKYGPVPARPSTALVKPRRIHNISGQLSQSRFSLSSKPNPQVKAMKRVSAPNIAVTQNAFQVPVPFGFQNQCFVKLYDVQSVLDILSTIPVSSGAGAKRCVIDNVVSELTMTNSTNASAEIEIWDLVLKRDLPSTANYSVGATNYITTADPVSYWQQGACASEGVSGLVSPLPSSFIGSSPFDSVLFKQYFKIKKRTQIMMPQGSTHRHTIVLKPNRLLDQFLGTAYGGGGLSALRGLTQFTMVNIKGVPVSDTDGGVPTTSSILLDVVQSIRSKHTWVADNTQTGFYQDNLTSPLAVNTQVLSAGSGLFANVATA